MRLLVTIDEAADRLKALDAADSSNAFEMGDIVLDAVPMVEVEREESTEGRAFAGAAGLFKDQGVTEALKELAEKAGMSWETLKTRRRVASRIPAGTRVPTVPFKTYRRIAEAPIAQRAELLQLVAQPNPDREDGRWTEKAIRTHLPKSQMGSAPERDNDPDEQVLDQVCRGIDHFLQANDIDRLERIRVYWERNVPPKVAALAHWQERRDALVAKRETRARAKAQATA